MTDVNIRFFTWQNCLSTISNWGEWQVSSSSPPCCGIFWMLTKSVDTRGTTAPCAECVQHGLGRNTPSSRHNSIPAAEDAWRPSILQLNTKELTASKISIIKQLDYKDKVLVIIRVARLAISWPILKNFAIF